MMRYWYIPRGRRGADTSWFESVFFGFLMGCVALVVVFFVLLIFVLLVF